MTRKIRFISAFILVLLSAGSCCADEVQDLLNFYVRRFKPEKASLVISGKPDETGMFNDIFMDLSGVNVENLRIDRLTFRMRGVQFNEPSHWAKGNVECKEAIQVLALANILEKDINDAIEAKTFGDKDHWHDVSMKITPSGLKGRGYYVADIVLTDLDILLEINSKLKILKGKQLWLDNPLVKVNKLDVPDYVTRKALSQIQPLVDLNRLPLPVSLHKVDLKNGSAVLSTRTLPKPLTEGLKYSYPK